MSKLQEKSLFSLHESTDLQLQQFRKYSVSNEQRFKFRLKALPSVWSCKRNMSPESSLSGVCSIPSQPQVVWGAAISGDVS